MIIVHKVAIIATALLSMSYPSWAAIRGQGKGRGNNKNKKLQQQLSSFFEEVIEEEEESSIECNVYLAMHTPLNRLLLGDDAIGGEVEDDDTEDLLQCITDDEHIYEIEGLDDSEKRRITNEVTEGRRGKSSHRYAFPGATKKKRKGRGSGGGGRGKRDEGTDNSILEIPSRRSGNGRRHQAMNISPKQTSNTRQLYRTNGISSILLLRIEAADASTTCTHQDCAARTFGGYDSNGVLDDSMNLITQIDDCSYGKLKFVLPEYNTLYPNLINGTATIYLPDKNVTDVHHGTVLDWALEVAPSVVGDLGMYDHIMVYMPPGVAMGGAAAWGQVGWKYSWYHDGYSLMTGIHLHELGHNFGLGHSTGGETCYMAYGGGDTRKCYNAPKSHWLGWYSEFHQTLDPVSTRSKLVELVGIADYDEAMISGDPSSQAVVLKIDTYGGTDLYLTYNRKEKVNSDASDYVDQVTITGAPSSSSTSWIVRALNPGQKYHASLVEGTMILEIIACHRYYGSPDTFPVSIHVVGEGEPMCQASPPIPSWGAAYAGSLQDGLVGYYPFDDTLNSALDSGYHGKVGGGSVSYVDGPVGRALSLNGIDEYVSLPNVDDFNFGTGDFTITFWYRVSGDQSGTPAIITNKDWNSGLNPGWLLGNHGSGYNGDDLSINLSDGSVRADASSAMDVSFNNWHFVAMRVKRGQNMSLLRSTGAGYGLQEDSIDSVSGSVNSGLPILIGTSYGYTAKTKMDMDDLGIWRRALSSEEVDSIYTVGLEGKQLITAMDTPLPNEIDPVPSGHLVANYELESDVKDTSGNSLDATLEDGGGVSFGTSDSGSSYLTLDNINAAAKSFATLPESSLLDFSTGNFTIAFWHRTSVDYSTVSPSDVSIVTNKNFQSGGNAGFTVGIGTNGRLEYNSSDGAGSRCDYDGPGGTMNDGQWHHVVLNQEASGAYALYLDGKKVTQASCALSTLSSGYPIRIGASWVYPSFYSGDVDKISIYDLILSHAQIFDLYLQGRGVVLTNSPTTSVHPTNTPTLSPTTDEPSPSPTSSPLSCDGVVDNILCCGTDSVKQADYRGTISSTQSGVECQAWDSQSPHTHSRTPSNYWNSGLESNYCRNPDGEPRAWCYTSDPNVRWDYCTIPSCGIATPPPTPKLTGEPTSASPTSDSPTSAEPSPSPSMPPITDEPTTNAPTSAEPTLTPSESPSNEPTSSPSLSPSRSPSKRPSLSPSKGPSYSPSASPTLNPSSSPTDKPTLKPSDSPSSSPTAKPITNEPTSDAPTSDAPTSDAPTISPVTDSPTSSVLNDPETCGLAADRQAGYRGNVATTTGGVPCQNWDSQFPHSHSRTPANYPDKGLVSNYCRNPDGEPRAWCYTTDSGTRWDYCDVQYCDGECYGSNPDTCGCDSVRQRDYRGLVNTTATGLTCQNWDSQFPHSHGVTPGNYPNSGLDNNYCRNADNESGGVWCYTTDRNVRWAYCNVPSCTPE